MDYAIAMLEGIITFVSPCLLPMLPIYVSYFFSGGADRKRAFINALGFVAGFTAVFTVLGAFAGIFSRLLIRHASWINLIAGAVVVVFGLHFLGILKVGMLNKTGKLHLQQGKPGFFSSVLFGIVFSLSWTPCVGAFLGSALMLAATAQDSLKGILMLLSYSLGLGIPFLVSALLLDRLKGAFDIIKKHYDLITSLSGIFLILVGIAMMTGVLGRLLALLT